MISHQTDHDRTDHSRIFKYSILNINYASTQLFLPLKTVSLLSRRSNCEGLLRSNMTKKTQKTEKKQKQNQNLGSIRDKRLGYKLWSNRYKHRVYIFSINQFPGEDLYQIKPKS